MHRDEVDLGQDRLEVGDLGGAGFLDVGLGDVGIEHVDVHLEGDAALDRARADAAHADHQDRLAGEIGRQVADRRWPQALLAHEAVVLAW